MSEQAPAEASTEASPVEASPVEASPVEASPVEASTGQAASRGYRKVREGLVVSDKMDKTVVVVVEDRVKHPKYNKVLRRRTKYVAHDERNECGVGDRVVLSETRPLSATKRWRVAQIVEKAK